MKDYYTHVGRSNKAYVCDDCGGEIPQHSAYKHFTSNKPAKVSVEGKSDTVFVSTKYRLHETCRAPAEMRALWQAHDDQLADWGARQEAVQARLRALGFEAAKSYPDSVIVSVDCLEALLDRVPAARS